MFATAKATLNLSCSHFEGMKLASEITSVSRPQNEALILALKNYPSPNRTKNGQNSPLMATVLQSVYKLQIGFLSKRTKRRQKSTLVKKYSSPIYMKTAFCTPCSEKCLQVVYTRLCLNSHMKMKSASPFLHEINLPLTYMQKNRVLVRYFEE